MSLIRQTSSGSQHTDSQSFSQAVQKNGSPQRDWVRQVLCKYLSKYVRDYLASRKDSIPSPVVSTIDVSDGNGNSKNPAILNTHFSFSIKKSEPGHEDINHSAAMDGSTGDDGDDGSSKAMENLEELTILDLEIIEETALGDDRITYLSRILSLAVNYSVVGHPDHFVQWIVKVPSRHFDERNLARLTNVHGREVSFYNNILQDIKLWLEHNYTPPTSSDPDPPKLSFNVPTCYYARAERSDSEFDPEVYDFPNNEFTLVLEDLRAQGFGKRHFSIGLTFEEAIEAIREITKFHATCWAMEQHSHEGRLHWKHLLKWNDLHTIYLDMIRQGFRHLRIFKHQLKDESRLKLVESVLKMEAHLPQILERLLKPLPPPGVTTLVHMDLWTDNLLFRETELAQDDTDEEETEKGEGAGKEEKAENCVDLDCMILDWQMISLGRITHDLGILIMTSLDGEMRRRNGMELLKFYYGSFQAIISPFKLEIPFRFTDFVDQYKESCLLATLLSIGRMDLVVSEQSTLDRFFSALEDLKDEKLI